MRAASRLPAPFLERFVEIGFRDLPGRDETKHQSTENGKSERKGQHRNVYSQLIPTGSKLCCLAGVGGPQRIDTPKANEYAQSTAHQGDYQAFAEQLANYPPATGTQRRAQGNLFLTAARARQHQVGNIRAGN